MSAENEIQVVAEDGYRLDRLDDLPYHLLHPELNLKPLSFFADKGLSFFLTVLIMLNCLKNLLIPITCILLKMENLASFTGVTKNIFCIQKTNMKELFHVNLKK